MNECQVQRTLVKSPPELWEALSDPAALARHLGEFGEIRITRVEPETKVEWEAERATGTVEITPSGWGTKVTLTAMPLAADTEPEPAEAEATTAMVVWTEPQPFPPPREAEAAPEAEVAAQAAPEGDAGPEAGIELETADEPAFEEAAPVVAQTPPVVFTPRRTWLQRLFGRGVVLEVPPEPGPVEVPHEPAPAEPIQLPVDPTPQPEIPDEPAPAAEVPLATMEPDVPTVEFSVTSMWQAEEAAAEPGEPEADAEPGEPEAEPGPAIDDERATAVLESVLDDLGAAHHRPFSR